MGRFCIPFNHQAEGRRATVFDSVPFTVALIRVRLILDKFLYTPDRKMYLVSQMFRGCAQWTMEPLGDHHRYLVATLLFRCSNCAAHEMKFNEMGDPEKARPLQ